MNAAFQSLWEKVTNNTPTWDPNKKVFKGQVNGPKSAQELLDAMRELDGHADDLPTVIDVAAFAEARFPTINLIFTDSPTSPPDPPQQVIAAEGDTYRARAIFADYGFNYERNALGMDDVDLWVAVREDVDVDALKADLTAKDFVVNEHTGIE